MTSGLAIIMQVMECGHRTEGRSTMSDSKIKNKAINDLCIKNWKKSNRKQNSKKLFGLVKQLIGNFSATLTVIKDEHGHVLME